jgi:hypothetical protein
VTKSDITAFFDSSSSAAVIAIPARNEGDRIGKCLAALAIQRDRFGTPVPQGAFEVLVLANNCNDNTAEIVRLMALQLPYLVSVIEIWFPARSATAGNARRYIMNRAAERLASLPGDGIILSTDADSVASPTWFAENMYAIDQGADCVAGYIDAEPLEFVGLGADFLARGRLEDAYLRQVAEIYARCDPRPHDPWPNHRVSSGASLAVKLSTYRAVGGLPPKAVGEDIAFTDLLDRTGFRVRHALDVSVVTSCRLDGRASGGAADTMRHRRDVPNAPCDAELEPALPTLRRAVLRGLLRKAWHEGTFDVALRRRRQSPEAARLITKNCCFNDAWQELCMKHPATRLRPSDLPRQIAIAGFILRHLRAISSRLDAQADKCPRERSIGSAVWPQRRQQKDCLPQSPPVDSRFLPANDIK